MIVRETAFSARQLPPEDRAPGGSYQRFISVAFLICAALMVSQYTVYKYGPAIVIVAPFGNAKPDRIAYNPRPKEGVADSEVQKKDVVVLNWATFDKVQYMLHSTTSIPPDYLTALLFLLALPLLAEFGRANLWPRWPQWFFLALGCYALLGAEAFNGGVKEVAQWGLSMVATWWLATVALADSGQVRRFGKLLLGLTIALLLLALPAYIRYVLIARPVFDPTLVRASLQSRSAYCGVMSMLLCFAYARALAARQLKPALAWGGFTLLGALTLMTAGGLVALWLGCLAMAFARGVKPFLLTLVPVPLLFVLVTYDLNKDHWKVIHASTAFVRVDDKGTPQGVEKRYLEMGAALNLFNGTRDHAITVTDPKSKPGEDAQKIPIGAKSSLLFGVGPGLNYQESIGACYDTLDNPKKQEPDTYTLYLLLACQLGLFGAVAWAWILWDGVGVAKRAHDGLAPEDLRVLALGVYGALVAVTVFSVWGTLLLRGTGLLLFTLLALAARLEWLVGVARDEQVDMGWPLGVPQEQPLEPDEPLLAAPTEDPDEERT